MRLGLEAIVRGQEEKARVDTVGQEEAEDRLGSTRVKVRRLRLKV